jgi:hypothetical protein
MIRLVQIACVIVLALVLYGVRVGLDAVFDVGGPGFPAGFLFGILVCFSVYGIICWIDPSSRPRGSSTDK